MKDAKALSLFNVFLGEISFRNWLDLKLFDMYAEGVTILSTY